MKVDLERFDEFDICGRVNVEIEGWDTFNPSQTIALIVAPLLREYMVKRSGGDSLISLTDPQDAPSEFEHDAPRRWDWIISEIIHAFQTFVDKPRFPLGCGDPESFRVQRGLRLFAKYYGDLS